MFLYVTMLGQQGPPSPPAAGWPGLRRSARTCVLQARNPSPTQRRSAARADTSSSNQSASLSDPSSSGSDEDSDAQSWASEEEEEAGPRHSMRPQQHAARDSRDDAADLSAAAEPPADRNLHQPYSQLLFCESKFVKRNLCLATQLCTDLADLHSQGSCAVQVSVEVHPSGWDASEDCRAYVMQQQRPGAPSAAAAGSSQSHGPFAAILKQYSKGRMRVTALNQDSNLAPYLQQTNPHTLILQERVPGTSSPPHFRLHIQPGSPARPKNSYCQALSRAGEGKGLQVLPGSVTEVTEAGAAARHPHGTQITIPRVLLYSQLPSGAAFPLSISVTITEQQAAQGTPDRHLGHWEQGPKLYRNSRTGNVELQWPTGAQPLAAYGGRRIARLSLLPHQASYRLTVTFAPPAAANALPAAAAAAAAAAGGSLQPLAAAAAHTSAAAATAFLAAASGLETTPAAQSARAAAALTAPAATTPPPLATSPLLEAFAASSGRPGAQTASTAAAGGAVGGGKSVPAQGHAPAAVASGLLFERAPAGSAPAAAPASGAQAMLLPRKRSAAELQQPAATAAAAGRDSGSNDATMSQLETAAAAAAGAASIRKPCGSRLAVHQVVAPAAGAGDSGLGQAPAAAAAGGGKARVLLMKQEPLAAGAHSRLMGPLSPAADQPVVPPSQPAVQSLVQGACGGGAGAGPSAAAAAPAAMLAAAGPGPVCIKQEPPAAADVMDLTADSDGEQEEEQQQAAAPGPAGGPPSGGASAAPALAGVAAGGTTGPAAAPAAAAALALRGMLPAGLRLPPASTAAAMEQQLAAFMAAGLWEVLPPKDYSRLVKQLRVVFGRHARGEGVSAAQLQTLYTYVQAAVGSGEVGEVVSTLEDTLSRLV